MTPRVGGAGASNGRHGPPGHDWAFWLRPPFGFLWLLGLIGLVVVVGVFPIIRRLLKRLENLQRGVQRFGEGDLTVRVATEGTDEVADLARQFNAAASRIEELVQSHKSLLANASHELRSPLARIRMGLELMGGDASVAKAKREIQRNINELDQLVDEILLASRLEQPGVDVGTVESVDSDWPGGRRVCPCGRGSGGAGHRRRGGARDCQAGAPRRAQSAGKRAPLQPRRSQLGCCRARAIWQ